MKQETDLYSLRKHFNTAVAYRELSPSTIKRYRSWVRRYLRYCRNHRYLPNQESAQAFLQTLHCYPTHPQAYYALKFLFVRAMHQSNFIPFHPFNDQKDQLEMKKVISWWKRLLVFFKHIVLGKMLKSQNLYLGSVTSPM